MKHLLLLILLSISHGSFSQNSSEISDRPLRLNVNINGSFEVILIDPKTKNLLAAGEHKTVGNFQLVDDKTIAVAENNAKQWGYIDTQGKWLTAPDLDNARAFSKDNIARVQKGNKWGFVSNNGSFLIEPKYHQVRPFRNGFAAVQEVEDGEFYFINHQGQKVFARSFSNIRNFGDNGLAPVEVSESVPTFAIFKDKVIKKDITSSNGSKQWGYINNQGEMVIKPQYKHAAPFNQFNIARVTDKNDDTVLIDPKGNLVTDTQFEYLWPYSESGVAWSETKGNNEIEGYIDTKGQLVWQESYHNFSNEKNGLLANKRGDFQFFNPLGKLVIEEPSTWAASFDDAQATIALRKKRWGILLRNGTFKEFPSTIIAPLTTHDTFVIGFVDGLVPMITQDREVEYFNREGHMEFKMKASDNGLMALFDANNTMLWESEHKAHKIFASLAPGVPEYFSDNNNLNEGIYQTIDQLLIQQAKKYFIPNPVFSYSEDPYKLAEDLEEYEIFTGSINIIAETYTSEENWGTYEFLGDHDGDNFNDYYETILALITKKYGKPYYSQYGKNIWKVGDKYLSFGQYSDSGDGDYYIHLVLEVNQEKPDV